MTFSLEERRPVETDGRGNICYQIYGQDGVLIPMRCADTASNRLFILWLRQVDRYAGAGPCDSGRHAERENGRSPVEAEGCQSGGAESGASPKTQSGGSDA